MLSYKEEMIVFLLLLVQCLLRGSPLKWSERKGSDLFGVMDKDRKTEYQSRYDYVYISWEAE